jgi:NAD(P)-dependent dehydrogenase (short-subunit alcohol dehydrogenase family)
MGRRRSKIPAPSNKSFCAGGAQPFFSKSGILPRRDEFMTVKQFDKKTTTDEVLEGVDLSGKRFLVTGVSAGIGVETARSLVAHGAHVVGTARDLAKGRAATGAVQALAQTRGGFELIELDLASLASVRKAADAVLKKGEKFDGVIANAGIMACPKSFTEDGFETQFGVNHLGHFVFVNRIVPLFKPGSILVNLSSGGHRASDINLEDPNFDHSEYTEFGAYGRAKTANILFAVEFDRRHKAAGIRAAAVHPGVIRDTELSRHLSPEAVRAVLASLSADPSAPPLFPKNIPQGAATSVWTAVVASRAEVGGKYCEDCHVAEVSEGVARIGVCKYALDPENARALWAKSEEMVGERF